MLSCGTDVSRKFVCVLIIISADEPARSDWHCELSATLNNSTVHKDSTAGASDANGGLLCIWLNVGLRSPRGTKQLLGLQ